MKQKKESWEKLPFLPTLFQIFGSILNVGVC